jgi:hypothetical protein
MYSMNGQLGQAFLPGKRHVAENNGAQPWPIHAWALIHVILMGTAIAFTISSTVVYWMGWSILDYSITIDLWHASASLPEESGVTSTTDSKCDTFNRSFAAAEAFAIISCVVAAAAFGFGLVTLRTGRLWLVSLILGAALMGTAIICWAVVLSTYTQSFCGSESFKDLGFDLGPGLYLMVAASITGCLSIIALVCLRVLRAAVNLPQGNALPDVHLQEETAN